MRQPALSGKTKGDSEMHDSHYALFPDGTNPACLSGTTTRGCAGDAAPKGTFPGSCGHSGLGSTWQGCREGTNEKNCCWVQSGEFSVCVPMQHQAASIPKPTYFSRVNLLSVNQHNDVLKSGFEGERNEKTGRENILQQWKANSHLTDPSIPNFNRNST